MKNLDGAELDDSCFKTPACPDVQSDEDARRLLAINLEKTRAEARARARLKSDEELCQAVSNRSGARYRSSSLREQVMARTKSHEVLSPRNSEALKAASRASAEDGEPLKRKTFSEELTTAKTTAVRRSTTPPRENAIDFLPTIDNSPTSPIVEAKKPRSFLSKLLNQFSPPSSTSATPSTPSPKPTVAASESNKETSLLSKIGWKYGPNKRRSRGSLSPQQSLEKTQEEPIIVKEMSPLKNAPKASGK